MKNMVILNEFKEPMPTKEETQQQEVHYSNMPTLHFGSRRTARGRGRWLNSMVMLDTNVIKRSLYYDNSNTI